MSNVTITLTKDQAHTVANVLSYEEGWVQNNDFPRSDSNNAFYERIRRRILKGLAKAKS